MPFILNSKNRTLTVKLDGELDLVRAHEFRETVDRAMDEMQSQNLIIDLSRVTFIDSSGLGVILGRFRKVKGLKGEMYIVGASPNIKRILELSGITVFIPIYQTEADVWKIMAGRTVKEA